MFHQILTYLRWLPKTIHLHGIHSPFVFQLEKQCLKDNTYYPAYNRLKAYRKSMLNNHKMVTIIDFGTGSRVFKSNQRKLSAMVRYAGSSLQRTKLLYRLVTYFKPKTILELGTSLGMGTIAFAIDGLSTVTTLEGCPEIAQTARHHLDTFGCSQVNIQVGPFEESLKEAAQHPYDLVYFDGNHNKTATLAYVRQLLPTAHNDTLWIFDDIHWSRDMSAAWQEITALPQVTVVIDCFWFGLVFFRKEQAKQCFYLNL